MTGPIRLITLGGAEARDSADRVLSVSGKRLALLVYLAVARPRGPHQRDTLLALFYPEKDTARARQGLRQLLHVVRTGLGDDVLVQPTRETVELNRERVHCDVWAFEEAVTRGDFEPALRSHTGPFLAGFHVPGCPDFADWVEAERARIHRAYVGSLEQAALSWMQRGEPHTASRWWRALVDHEPYASRVTLGLMEALADAGDRAGALQAAEEHGRRLESDLGAERSRDVEALAARLRTEPARRERRTRAVAERLAVALAGRYEIQELLGVGGTALVYRARDLKHERPVALKVLRPELAAAMGPDRFLQEVAIAAQLNHPNILPLHDSGEADGLLYFVMPYIEGESLRDVLAREGQLPLDDAVRLAQEIAEALDCAHADGVVHRDVKPENILVSRGHALIADFGVARALSGGRGEASGSADVTLGTPEYASPEQVSGRQEVDGRTDVYSLGCVLYEMLGGTPPYTGTTPQQVLAGHLQRPVPSVRKLNGAVPGDVDAVIGRAIAKRPEDRFDTAREFSTALQAARTSAPPVPGAERRRPRRRARYAALAVAAAALLTVWTVGIRRGAPVRDTDVAAAALDPSLLAVMPFAAAGHDSTLEVLAADMPILFWMKLTGDYGVRAADHAEVLREWREARGSAGTPVTEAEAIRIAETVGAGRVVIGAIARRGQELEFTAVLRSVPGGESRQEITVWSSADRFTAAVDELVVRLLVDEVGGESLARLPSLASHPPQAVKAFLAAERIPLGADPYRDSALAWYERAYRLDPTFALAAMQRYNRGEKDRLWAERAWSLRDRLSERDREALRAMAGDRFGDVLSTRHKVALWDSLARRYPEALSYWRNISNWTMWASGAFGLPDWRTTVREASDRVLSLDSTYQLSAVERFSLAVLDGDVATARRLLPNTERDGPDPRTRWMLGVLEGDGGAVAAARTAFRDYPGSLYLVTRSAVVMGKGLDDAERAARIMAETGRNPTASGPQYDWTAHAYHRGRFADWVRRRDEYYDGSFTPLWAAALRISDALYAAGPSGESLKEAERLLGQVVSGEPAERYESWERGVAHCWLAQWRLANGDTTGVGDALTYMRTQVPHAEGYAPCRALVEALAARLEGADPREAVLRLDSVVGPYPTLYKRFGDARDGLIDYDSPVNVVLAQLLREIGAYQRALAASRRRTESPYYVTIFLVNHLREEGRLAAMTGDTAGAIRAYDHYLRLRSEPPDHAPWRAQRDSVLAERAALQER